MQGLSTLNKLRSLLLGEGGLEEQRETEGLSHQGWGRSPCKDQRGFSSKTGHRGRGQGGREADHHTKAAQSSMTTGLWDRGVVLGSELPVLRSMQASEDYR